MGGGGPANREKVWKGEGGERKGEGAEERERFGQMGGNGPARREKVSLF